MQVLSLSKGKAHQPRRKLRKLVLDKKVMLTITRVFQVFTTLVSIHGSNEPTRTSKQIKRAKAWGILIAKCPIDMQRVVEAQATPTYARVLPQATWPLAVQRQ